MIGSEHDDGDELCTPHSYGFDGNDGPITDPILFNISKSKVKNVFIDFKGRLDADNGFKLEGLMADLTIKYKQMTLTAESVTTTEDDVIETTLSPTISNGDHVIKSQSIVTGRKIIVPIKKVYDEDDGEDDSLSNIDDGDSATYWMSEFDGEKRLDFEFQVNCHMHF